MHTRLLALAILVGPMFATPRMVPAVGRDLATASSVDSPPHDTVSACGVDTQCASRLEVRDPCCLESSPARLTLIRNQFIKSADQTVYNKAAHPALYGYRKRGVNTLEPRMCHLFDCIHSIVQKAHDAENKVKNFVKDVVNNERNHGKYGTGYQDGPP